MLPLGYSFNLDGSMMYCTFATMFIAQAYGIQLSSAQQITMLLLLMVTSQGHGRRAARLAGGDRRDAALRSTCREAGLLLILAVDHFLDMGRSATNVSAIRWPTAVVGEMGKGNWARSRRRGNACLRHRRGNRGIRLIRVRGARTKPA